MNSRPMRHGQYSRHIITQKLQNLITKYSRHYVNLIAKHCKLIAKRTNEYVCKNTLLFTMLCPHIRVSRVKAISAYICRSWYLLKLRDQGAS